MSDVKCPNCSQAVREGAKFCPHCGYNIGEHEVKPPQAVQPPPPVQGVPAGRPIRPQPPVASSGGTPPATQRLETVNPDEVKLIVRWMGGSTQDYQITKQTATVGRAPGNDIVVNHPAVSGRHLSLDLVPGAFTITDLNSTNGTLVNGQRIPSGTPHRINMGDAIRIGDLTGNWISLGLQAEGAEAVRQLSLGQLDLSQLTSVVIGRDPESFLPLNHPTVSFRHAMISKQDSSLTIRDLGSTNGTFVNGQRITQAPLKSGDVVQIGPFKLTYDAQQQSLAQSMGLGHRIDALRLGREVGKKKMILQEVNMTVNPGEFVALVGGSGAGKSTLMKAMNGYEPANHGKILLDGEPLYEKLDLYRTQMGYVPQDDIIHRALPVKLALRYAAKLRLPDARPSEIEARIQDALKAVDMVEHQDKRVFQLSGGQRKRVSIAVELLARPTLFFLDEPTSGLDPGLEKKMMYDLNRLANEGRTVVLVTHATANIEQCDNVAFLSWGRLAYYGPPNEALQFYNVRDFSDIYLKLSQDVDPAHGSPPPPELAPYYQKSFPKGGKVNAGILWADHYRQSPAFKKYVVDRQSQINAGAKGGAGASGGLRRSRDSFIRQTIILARRQFDLIRLDLRTLLILLLMMPLIGALFGMVSNPWSFVGEVTYNYPEKDTYAEIEAHFKEQLKGKTPGTKEAEVEYIPLQDAQMLVIMLSLALTQGGTFAAAYEMVKERAIFRRERAVNLKVFAYVLSKVLVLGIFASVQIASVMVVLNLFNIDMSFPGTVFPDNPQLELFITFYLGVVASIMFGLMISALVPTSDVVLYAILVQLFVQIILGGSLFPIDSPLISKMTISYWTTIGSGSTVDLPKLNGLGMACQNIEIENPMTGEKTQEVNCAASKTELSPGGSDTNKDGDYKHTPEKVIGSWIGTLVHFFVYFVLTLILTMRQKTD